jgi:hypothetical protein
MKTNDPWDFCVKNCNRSPKDIRFMPEVICKDTGFRFYHASEIGCITKSCPWYLEYVLWRDNENTT